jgi:hypothetical protein
VFWGGAHYICPIKGEVMNFAKLVLVLLSFSAGSAFASEHIYKYSVVPFFGMKNSCKVNGKDELSQVRFIIPSDEIKSNKQFIKAEILVNVCLITGDFVREGHVLTVPRFLFTEAAPMQGTFKIENAKLPKLSVNELKKDQWQIRYFDAANQPWKSIDPIELTIDPKVHRPTALRFLAKSKNKWLDAKLRLFEVQ